MNKIVVACVTGGDLAMIQRLSRAEDTEVVAVVFDLGDGLRLRELQDQACAAGARRCHVIDLREEFARDYLLPALQREPRAAADVRSLVHACMTRKLAQVAELEGTTEIGAIARDSVPAPFATTLRSERLDRSARIAISFEDDIPVAVNAVPMPVVELLESLGTIGAVHGLDGSSAALNTLQHAYQAIDTQRDADMTCAWLELVQGRIEAAEPAYATT